MEIFIKNNKVQFTQGCPTFGIDYEGDTEELKFVAEQLDTAFRNFIHEIKIQTINEITEKTINKLCYHK